MNVKYRKLGRKVFQAIVTDNQGDRWVWTEPIHEVLADYQGPMGMLGGTHKTTAYDVEGYGLVPEGLRHSNRIDNHIRGRFLKYPEEFIPYYSLREYVQKYRK